MLEKLFLKLCSNEMIYSNFDDMSFRGLFEDPKFAEMTYQYLKDKYPYQNDLKDAIMKRICYWDIDNAFFNGEHYLFLKECFNNKDLKYEILCLLGEKEKVTIEEVKSLASKYKIEK